MKALLTLAFVGLASLALSYVVLHGILLPVFGGIEESSARANLRRVRQAIVTEYDEIGTVALDWAVWDESYYFVIGSNDDYVDRELGDDPGLDPDIDLLIYFNLEGTAVFAQLEDRAAQRDLSIDDLDLELIIDHLLDLPEPYSQARGLLSTAYGPMLLTSAAIVRTSGVGHVGGALVAGRWLVPRVESLGRLTQVDFDAYATNDPGLPTSTQAVLAELVEREQGTLTTAAAANLATHEVLLDLGGAPAVVLEIRTPRTITSAGERTVTLALYSLTAAGLLSMFVTWRLLQRVVVRPLRALLDAARTVARSKDYSVRVQRNSEDEIGKLADAFNDMLTQVQRRDELVQEARLSAEKASDAKSIFLATMSHEIRTPMNGVVGMLEILMQSPLSETQREYAQTAVTSADKLLDIINDVLDFSKFEAGKMALEKRPFHLRRTVEDAVRMVAETAHSKGLELTWSVDDELPVYCLGDPTRVGQILMNLLGNAVKFSSRGEVVVTVSAYRGGDLVRFEVADTGCGIDDEAQKDIFDPFVQADGSITRAHGGTGLGLAICKQLAEAMRGEIGMLSEQGVGSTFWFAVPLPRSATQAEPEQDVAQTLQGVRTLIVDDNATNLRVLSHQARAWQMPIGTAKDGETALELLREGVDSGNPYEVAILDMDMPGMSGLDLARRISEQPELADLAMIMLTSLGSDLDPDEMARVGIRRWLTKPAGHSRLRSALVEAVRQAGSSEASARLVEPASSRKETGLGLRVLVVEDDIVNEQVITAMLECLECEAEVARNGAWALSSLVEPDYDVVLMDCQMPVMDGYSATRALRRREAAAGSPRILIIGLTANALSGDRDKCLAAGMDDYLAKPVKIDQLGDLLRRYFPDSRRERAG